MHFFCYNSDYLKMSMQKYVHGRGGSRNSLRGGGGVLGQNSSKGGFRVQVRRIFHILTSKKKKKL